MTRPLLTLVLVLALAGAATLGATSDGAADELRYTVVLDNAFGLTEGSDLRSAGVVIGTIAKLDVQRSTARALATIEVTRPSFAGFHEDVFCEVKPQSLIGEYYLDCDPGTRPGPAPRTIPVEQTAGTIPPDVVLDIMRRPARERFGIILTELGIGFAGRGDDVQATLRRAVPALRETDKVVAILNANRRTLTQLTRDGDKVLAALSRNRRDVARFVSETADTTEISASRSRDLRATINKLPRFLRELRPTLADLGTTARLQTPALRDLRIASPRLTEFLRRLGPFSDSARPAFRGLGRASDTGIPAVKAARSTIRQLRDLGSVSTEPMRNLRFVLEEINDRDKAVEPNRLSPTGKGFTGIEAFLQYLFVQSQAINLFDSKSYILKLNILVNECGRYTNAETARDDKERTEKCKQWIGPNQPNINTAVVSRTTPKKPKAGSKATPDSGAPQPDGAPAPQTAEPAPAAPRPLLPDPKDLLDDLIPPKVTDNLPKLPDLLPKRGIRRAPSADSERSLLDFLLGP